MSRDGLKRLKVWVVAKDLAVEIVKEIIPLLPDIEKYALSQQLRRAAYSIPGNIAEGYGRYYYQENIRFCYIARGSLEETINYLVLANEMEYFSKSKAEEIIKKSDQVVQMLNGYIAYLKRTKQGESEFPKSKSIKEDDSDYEITGEIDGVDL